MPDITPITTPEKGRLISALSWIALLILGFILIWTLIAVSMNPIGAGDQVKSIEYTAKAKSFAQLLNICNYSWWLLAQVWILKIAGILSISSAKALSSAWLIVGLLAGLWICFKHLKLHASTCCIFLVTLGGSAEVLSWAHSPHSIYMASFAMGGVVLLALLALDKVKLEPSAQTTLWVAIAFGIACLYSPVQGVLIGTGLLILVIIHSINKPLRISLRNICLSVSIGIPALAVSLFAIIMFPHPQIGNAPSYAYPYLFEQSGTSLGPIAFVASRFWFLLVQVYSTSPPRNGGLEFVGWMLMFLASASIFLITFRSNRRSWRLTITIIMLSLIPTAILSTMSWYPFGYVRYERYAVIGLALIPSIGAQSIWNNLLARHAHKATIKNVLIVFASALFVLLAWNWIDRGYREMKQTEQSKQLLSTLKKELQSTPLVADFWSQDTVWLTGSDQSPHFLIPRSVLVNQRDWKQSEQEQLTDLIKEEDRLVILLSGNPKRSYGIAKPYQPLFQILADHGFKGEPARLSVWTRVAKTPQD